MVDKSAGRNPTTSVKLALLAQLYFKRRVQEVLHSILSYHSPIIAVCSEPLKHTRSELGA